jgi:DNA-binding transcriptional LysR family regulator
MNIQTLEYFIAVAEAENLSRACERYGINQSALSYQMRSLEEELNAELFTRRGRSLRLSPVGTVFLEDARKIVAAVAQAEGRFSRAKQGAVGELRVGFETIASRNRIVSNSLLQFRESFPGVTLLLFPMTVQSVLDAIHRGDVDVGFVQMLESNPDLHAITFQRIDWRLVVPKTHRLAQAPSVRLRDLRDEPFVWRPRKVSPVVYDRMLAACLAGGLVPNIVQEVYNEDMMVNLVSVGLGICFLVETTEDQCPSTLAVFRKVEDFSMPIDLCMVYRRDNRSAALLQLLDIFQALSGSGAGA